MTLLHRLGQLLMYFASALLAVLAFFVALSAVMRYAVGSPFRFTEEFVGFLFIATVFLTLPLCFVQEQNIRMTLILDRLPAKLQQVARPVGAFACIAFVWLFGRASLEFTVQSFDLDARGDMSDILLWPWMAIMPLTIILVGLILVARLLPGIFGRANPALSSAPDQLH